MFRKSVAISVLLYAIFSIDIHALSIDSVGVMTRDNPSLPATGFALSFTAPFGFLSVTTDSSPGNVIFNANASASYIRMLDNTKDDSQNIIRLIIAGTTTQSALIDTPEVGIINFGNNEYVGLIELTLQKDKGKDEVIQTRRSNFVSEFEACVGDAPTGQLPAGFPQGDMNFCRAQDFSKINYVDYDDVVDHFSAWAPYLVTDRTLTSGNTVFEE